MAVFSLLQQVEEFANALGYAIGSDVKSFVQGDLTASGGFTTGLQNSYFNALVADQSPAGLAAVAKTMTTSFGMNATDNGAGTGAYNYILGQLQANPNNLGHTVVSIVNLWNSLANDQTYGSYVQAWNAQVTAAQNFNGTGIVSFTSGAATPTSISLTTGIDNIPATANAVINGVISNSFISNGASSTFNAGDVINGAANTTLNLVDAGNTFIGGPGPQTATLNLDTIAATVNGVPNLSVTSGEAVFLDVAKALEKFSGLANINVIASSSLNNPNFVAATSSQNVTLTDYSANSSTTTIDQIYGGNNVTLNANVDGTNATAINVGGANTTAVATPAGAVVINETITNVGTSSGAAINVYGGSTVKVNANLTQQVGGSNNTTTGGIVTVNGSSITTSVEVDQSAAATARNAAVAVTGVAKTNTLTAAAPGQAAVAASTATAPTPALSAVTGVVDGQVVVVDTANTIQSVTLNNFGTASSVTSTSATNLTLSSLAGDLTFTDAKAHTLNVNSNGLGHVSGVGSTEGKVNTVALTDNTATTLNVTNAGTAYLSLTAPTLTTLNISGAGSVVVSVPTTVATLTVSGSAGFNDGGSLLSDVALTSFTTTSSGTIKATLNDVTTSFQGSTGTDIITISADAEKTITAGSGANNEIIFNNSATTFNATTAMLTNTNVTGFTVFGLGASSGTLTWDLSTFNSGFNVIDITAGNTNANVFNTIVNAAKGTTLQIDAPSIASNGLQSGTIQSSSGSTSLSFASTTGATDTANINFVTNGDHNFAYGAVTLASSNGNGVGNVVITNNTATDLNNTNGASTTNIGAYTTIGALTDSAMSSLTLNGSSGFIISTLTDSATSLTIGSNETGLNGTSIAQISDAKLGAITFTGSANTTITTLDLTGLNAAFNTISLTNSGTAHAALNHIIDAAQIATLNVDGYVQLGTLNPGATIANYINLVNTGGVIVSAATDNAQVNVYLTGAVTGAAAVPVADTITVGNGNNNIIDLSLDGVVNVTVGTGFNNIQLGNANALVVTNITNTYIPTANALYNVTLGAHVSSTTAYDLISVATVGNSYVSSSVVAPNTVITGVVANDVIQMNAAFSSTQGTSSPSIAYNTAGTLVTLTAAQTASVATAANVTSAISTLLGFAHSGTTNAVASAVYQGNTYVVENLSGAATTSSYVVELVGVHSIASVGANGHVVLAS